jgi:hypothetical protein
LRLTPLTLKEANNFVARYHRHHKPTVGHKFSIGVKQDDTLVGVAIIGRPVARAVNAATVAEVTRLCTDGTPHVCSKLYAAAARACEAMGYQTIQTYILHTEPGTTLKAAGWRHDRDVRGRAWQHTSGPRRQDQPTCDKQCWVKDLRPT